MTSLGVRDAVVSQPDPDPIVRLAQALERRAAPSPAWPDWVRWGLPILSAVLIGYGTTLVRAEVAERVDKAIDGKVNSRLDRIEQSVSGLRDELRDFQINAAKGKP